MAQIVCPACHASVPTADVDLATQLAKCACGEVFDFSSQARSRIAPLTPRRDLAPPPGLSVVSDEPVAEEEGGYRRGQAKAAGRRVLSRRWFRPEALFLLFFCIAWDSFLVFWYSMAFGIGSVAGPVSIIMVVFPVAHVAVGVALTYYTAALFLNRTTITLDGASVNVRHAPLPWLGAGTHGLDGTTAVYAEPVQKHGRRGRTTTTWTVFMDSSRSTAVPLVAGLPDEAQARCIAAHVADHAGL